MRRYLQGTLDYTCGIYAVINALSILYKIDLAQGRHIFQQTLMEVAKHPVAWPAFMQNQTDHYWLVRYMLERWCSSPPFALEVEQPFSTCLQPREQATKRNALDAAFSPYIGDEDSFTTQGTLAFQPDLAAEVWSRLCISLTPRMIKPKTVALIRFHRFIPRHVLPFVSHWTTLYKYEQDTLLMHDASAEENSIFSLQKNDILPPVGTPPHVVLVPASLVLLTRK